MGKKLTVACSLLIVTSLWMLRTTSVQAYIETYNWVAPFYRGYDEFYATYIVAYKTGSTAQLMVGVYNDWHTQINVTAVKVWFDWNRNYSSTQTPCIMKRYDYRSFIINFTVPSTSVASNIIPHRYRIYVEFTYDTSKSYWSYDPWEYFVVYSQDQADVFDLSTKYQAYYSNFPYYYFESAEASSLARRATIEASLGSQYYRRGDFTLAKSQYGTAVNLYEQALVKETEYALYRQELQLNVTQVELEVYKAQAEANRMQAEASKMQAEAAKTQAEAAKIEAEAAMVTANAVMNQSYAWLFFGAGFILIGIGVIVYAARKPKTP